jgi:hypothetical protein
MARTKRKDPIAALIEKETKRRWKAFEAELKKRKRETERRWKAFEAELRKRQRATERRWKTWLRRGRKGRPSKR